LHAKRFLLLLVPVALIIGVGCASSDTPSKAEYISQADAICRDADKALNQKIQETFGAKPPTPEQINAFSAKEAIPNLEDQLAALRALTPPEGDEETTTEIYDALEEGIAQLKEDPTVEEAPAAFQVANKQAREFGLVACGAGT